MIVIKIESLEQLNQTGKFKSSGAILTKKNLYKNQGKITLSTVQFFPTIPSPLHSRRERQIRVRRETENQVENRVVAKGQRVENLKMAGKLVEGEKESGENRKKRKSKGKGGTLWE